MTLDDQLRGAYQRQLEQAKQEFADREVDTSPPPVVLADHEPGAPQRSGSTATPLPQASSWQGRRWLAAAALVLLVGIAGVASFARWNDNETDRVVAASSDGQSVTDGPAAGSDDGDGDDGEGPVASSDGLSAGATDSSTPTPQPSPTTTTTTTPTPAPSFIWPTASDDETPSPEDDVAQTATAEPTTATEASEPAPQPTSTPPPTAEPTATLTPTAVATPTATPTPEPTATPSPTATPEPTAEPTATAIPTVTPTIAPTMTPTVTPVPYAGGVPNSVCATGARAELEFASLRYVGPNTGWGRLADLVDEQDGPWYFEAWEPGYPDPVTVEIVLTEPVLATQIRVAQDPYSETAGTIEIVAAGQTISLALSGVDGWQVHDFSPATELRSFTISRSQFESNIVEVLVCVEP